MNGLCDPFYGQDKYQDLWCRWKGKPLLLGDKT